MEDTPFSIHSDSFQNQVIGSRFGKRRHRELHSWDGKRTKNTAFWPTGAQKLVSHCLPAQAAKVCHIQGPASPHSSSPRCGNYPPISRSGQPLVQWNKDKDKCQASCVHHSCMASSSWLQREDTLIGRTDLDSLAHRFFSSILRGRDLGSLVLLWALPVPRL